MDLESVGSRPMLLALGWVRKRADMVRQLTIGIVAALVFFSTMSADSADRQVLHGQIPEAASSITSTGRLALGNRLNLAIALPLRNQEALTNLLEQLYDPTSLIYRRYLTADQFAQQFSPTEEDYQAVIQFAKSHGLTVVGTHPNRTLLNVSGSVAQIENAFHVTLRTYPHPTEERMFFAPDADPSLDLAVPVLEILGLDDFVVPQPLHHESLRLVGKANAIAENGSGPSGTYLGNDFRKAYVPDVTWTGAGQRVGLFQLDGYYTNDPIQYAVVAGLTNTLNITNILVKGFSGSPGVNNVEVALDIEMVMSMAPGAQIVVYEGTNGGSGVIDVLNRIATDNFVQQASASWFYGQGPAMVQVYQQMAGQGQTFFNSSGDRGAYNGTDTTKDVPYITMVGGTTLTTATNGSWQSETAWSRASWGSPYATGGGISTSWAIPVWQQGIDMSANHGSTTMHNVPDVAMIADYVYTIADNGQPHTLGGTSVATPLWAAFTALVNEKAASQSKPQVGFLNPALYAIGKGTNYSTTFHDITTGNNTNSSSPNDFYAVPGYDLCTGWGSPKPALIDALLTVNFVPQTGWTLASVPSGSQRWSCVASSADGATLVAASMGGAIYVSSTSGATWRSGPSADWRGVASSAFGTKLSAASWGDPIYVSADSGVTWTLTTSPSFTWRSMASSADGTKLVAGAVWEDVVEVSTNSGATWQAASYAPSDGLWMRVAWSADGNVLACVNSSQIYVSTNWGKSGMTTAVSDANLTAVAASTNGSTLVACGSSIFVSTNLGANWTITSAPTESWSSVACSANGQTLVAASGGLDGAIYASYDSGSMWTNITPNLNTPLGLAADWVGIACSADGSRLIAVQDQWFGGQVWTGFFPVAPSIWQQPVAQTVQCGQNASFSVKAGGTWPLTYQWYCSMTPLADSPGVPGSTNSILTLTALALSQAGDYSVIVANPYGSTNSVPITLLVQMTNPPRFDPITISAGGIVQGSVTGLAGPISIEASTNLIDWETVNHLMLTNSPATFMDSSATNCPQRFYRVRVE